MKKEQQLQATIGFQLAGIKTEQFALFPEFYKESEDVELQINVKFGISVEDKILGVAVKCCFTQKDTTILIIEAGHQYAIESEGLTSMVNSENHTVTLPQNLAAHLVLLTICTARGILHAKVENTIFSGFFVPSINLVPLVPEPVVINY